MLARRDPIHRALAIGLVFVMPLRHDRERQRNLSLSEEALRHYQDGIELPRLLRG
jgi:hypothetical protein